MILLAAMSTWKALALLFAGSLFLALLACVAAGFLTHKTTWNDRGADDDEGGAS